MKKLALALFGGALVAGNAMAQATPVETVIDNMAAEATSVITYALPVIGALIVAAMAIVLLFKAGSWIRRAIGRA